MTKEGLFSTLAYSHYDIGRKYVLTDHSYIDISKDDLGDVNFWVEYFTGLETKFGWDFVTGSANKLGISRIVEFEDEGVGIAGIRFAISDQIQKRGQIVGALRDYLPTIGIDIIDQVKKVNSLWALNQKLGYEDTIHIDLNLSRFEIFRITKFGIFEKKTPESKKVEFTMQHSKINWNSDHALMEALKDARFRAFSGVDLEASNGYNTWANYVLRPVYRNKDKNIEDILRAFVSVQLLSIFNSNASQFKNFGVKGKPVSVIVSGELTNSMDFKSLIVAILDGLQLRGTFDLILDKQMLIANLGAGYAQGVNNKEFIVSNEQVIRKVTRVFAPEIPGKGNERKVIFDGTMTNEISGSEGVYALTPSILYKDFPRNNKRTVFDGKFVKGAYVEGMVGDVSILNEAESIVDSVLIDARFKPVIYGPDYNSNKDKLKVWFNE